MTRRESYQNGSLVRRKRKNLPDLWEFRYRRYDTSDNSQNMRETLGDTLQYPTRASIMTEVQAVRDRINNERTCVYFRDLARKYEIEILPKLRPHTQATNKSNLRYLVDKFSTRRINDISAGEIDTWINSLCSKSTGKPLSRETRQHIKALAHKLWRQAMLWEYLKAGINPVSIARVTEGAKTKVRSVIISPEQYGKMLEDDILIPTVKIMIQVAMTTGMRASEILGLRWEDIDFGNGVIHVRRSVVGMHIDETKNPTSNDDVPMHITLANALKTWKRQEPCCGGWVFGSPITNRPYHASTLRHDHLRPAGQRVGFTNLGWHSFRHTHSANLEIVGASDRVQQASLRHADAAMTKHYGRHSPALMEKMRKAQDKVIQMLPTGTEASS